MVDPKRVMDACWLCRFWKPFDAAKPVWGNCRRHAPVVMDRAWTHPEGGLQRETESAFPETGNDYWCGDFQPIPEKSP